VGVLRRARNRTYILQYSETLLPGSWLDVSGLNPLQGTGTDTWRFSIPARNWRFYRVLVIKPVFP
jgi:hypothetical protein